MLWQLCDDASDSVLIENNGVVTARKRSLRRLCFYRCLSVHRGDMCGTWWGGVCGRGACVAGGVHGWGVCVAGVCAWLEGGHAWQGACMAGGCGGHAWQGVRNRGACVAVVCACHSRYYGIRSMNRRYASHWNAFLF